MPQFDKVTFFNQIFWLLLTYVSFYVLILRYYLPKVSFVLKLRTKKIFKELAFSRLHLLKENGDAPVRIAHFGKEILSDITQALGGKTKSSLCNYEDPLKKLTVMKNRCSMGLARVVGREALLIFGAKVVK